jgi:hypothetical protein
VVAVGRDERVVEVEKCEMGHEGAFYLNRRGPVA